MAQLALIATFVTAERSGIRDVKPIVVTTTARTAFRPRIVRVVAFEYLNGFVTTHFLE